MSTMSDQLFERRELTRVLTVPSKFVQKNIRGSLLGQLGAHVEGRCGVEGYVQPKSCVILEHSLGNVGLLYTGIRYKVRFHADICLPHKGQTFVVTATFRSKIGIHAEMSPIRVLLPRDLHIGNDVFDSIVEHDEIRFEVLGAEFKQNDSSIFVLGRFIEKTGVEAPKEEVKEVAEVALPSAPESDVKQVAIKPTQVTDAPRRRKRLNPAQTVQVNVGEPAAKGEDEGES